MVGHDKLLRVVGEDTGGLPECSGNTKKTECESKDGGLHNGPVWGMRGMIERCHLQTGQSPYQTRTGGIRVKGSAESL